MAVPTRTSHTPLQAGHPPRSLQYPSIMLPLKTYLVEDSPLIRQDLVATLEELAGVHVVGWASGENAAVGWLSDPEHDPGLVIVDLFLEDGSGLGVLRAMHDRARPLRTVVLSNYATPEVRQRCLELGAERVFDKSGDIEDLLRYCRETAALPN
jgi:DNA-binding NarL/FixJ family response regulator